MDDDYANIGRVATSKAGRDSGRNFIIVGICDEYHVLIADGELRKLANPKKKKLKHLKLHETVAETLRAKILDGKMQVFDAEVRKWLRQWAEQQSVSEEE